MNIAQEGKRFLSNLFKWPVYFLSYIFPRSKNIWVFGSYPKTFVDNSKYLFLKFYEANADLKSVKAVWITKDRNLISEMRSNGYRSYHKYSIGGFYYCLRASVYIYSWTIRDINFWLSGGARLISLWHGLPLKKIGLAIKDHPDNSLQKVKDVFNFYLYPSRYLKSTYFLSTFSPEISKIFKEAYPTKHLIHAVYPRVEHFLLDDAERTSYINTIANTQEAELLQYMKQFDKVWVYMPTFRDNKEDEKQFQDKSIFDYSKINSILKSQNTLLLIKFHVSLMNNVNGEKYSNIHFVNNKMDMYVILPNCTGLITDYSSIFFDFMLLKRPIVFYNFDIQTYMKNSRQFYFEYDEVACGAVINNFKDLCNWFEEKKYQNMQVDYDSYIQRFWGTIQKPYLAKQLYQINNGN